jgi:hypothetical protein
VYALYRAGAAREENKHYFSRDSSLRLAIRANYAMAFGAGVKSFRFRQARTAHHSPRLKSVRWAVPTSKVDAVGAFRGFSRYEPTLRG